MSARPFYETIYHVDGWTLADAFRPQPGWGTRTFTVKLADLPEHTEQEFVDMARQSAPERYRLTSVTLYPEGADKRVIWSTPPCPLCKALAKPAAGVPACAEPLPQRYTAGDIMQVISEYGTARYSEGVNDALNRGQLAVESHSAAKDRFNDLRLMLDAFGVLASDDAQPKGGA